MTLDGEYLATVDRVVGNKAILLVEDGGATVAERHYPADELPASTEEGSVCRLQFTDDDIDRIEILTDRTEARREKVREKLGRLSNRLGESDTEYAET